MNMVLMKSCCYQIFSHSFLTAIFPGEPGLAGFIAAKDDGSGGDYKL